MCKDWGSARTKKENFLNRFHDAGPEIRAEPWVPGKNFPTSIQSEYGKPKINSVYSQIYLVDQKITFKIKVSNELFFPLLEFL